MDQHTTSNCGETTYTLKGEGTTGDWSDIVDRSENLIQCRVYTLDWDFNEIVQRETAIVRVERNNTIQMQVCLPTPTEYPGHLLENLEHSISPEGSFQEINRWAILLHFTFAKGEVILRPLPSPQLPTMYLQRWTFSLMKHLISQNKPCLKYKSGFLPPKIVWWRSNILHIWLSLKKWNRLNFNSWLNDEYLMYLSPNKSNLLFPIHSHPQVGSFRLVAPWHPFFSPIEIIPQIEIVELEYSVSDFTLERPELVEWEERLNRTIKQRTKGRRPFNI